MLDIKHLKTLLALSQNGSMVAAAEALCLTQSALSHQLANLENLLDCELFFRKSRPIKLTPAGEELVKLAEKILPTIEQTLFKLEAYKEGQAGRLYMGVECHSCYEWLLKIWHQFRQDCPEIDFDIFTGSSFDPLPSLLKGEVDAVISTDTPQVAGVDYLPLFEYEMVMVCSPEHPFAQKTGVPSPKELVEETWIHYPVAPERLDLYRDVFWPHKLQPQSIRKAETTELILNLVFANKGLALLPDWLVESYHLPLITFSVSQKKPLMKRLYLAVRSGEQDNKAIQTFAQLALKA